MECLLSHFLNHNSIYQGENSLLRRGGGSGRGRGRGGTYTVATSAGNIVRVREKSITQEFEPWVCCEDCYRGKLDIDIFYRPNG